MKQQLIGQLKDLYHFKDIMEWRLRKKKEGFLPGVTLEETEREVKEINKQIKGKEDCLFEIMKEERSI
ncbi:hypothetical protein [Bacillus cereus]|uniref:hypothetical protein n=1 Tax=Bacillus cereus TaxID=1396 RepID=UPI000BF34D0E|nr:hypothetical protein [Bacillus cereus]PFC61607.1 hypothetical protein CN267_11115 [Bacillus cereus]